MSSRFWLWPSASFLPLYAGFCVVLLLVWRRALTWQALRRDRFEPLPTSLLRDPYVFAYLRGGRREAIRLAVFALLQRGALRFTGVSLVRHKWPGVIDVPMEKLVFDQLSRSLMTSVVVRHRELGLRVDALYGPPLVRAGLLMAARVHPGYFLVVAIVWVIAIVRWAAAPEGVGGAMDALAGVIAVVFTLVACWRRSPVTPLGKACVHERRTQFATHQAMATPVAPSGDRRSRTREPDANVLWLGALMGLTALPASAALLMSKVFPVAQGGTGGGSDGGWNTGGADSSGGSSGDHCSSSDGGSCDSGGGGGDSGGGGDGGGGGGGD